MPSYTPCNLAKGLCRSFERIKDLEDNGPTSFDITALELDITALENASGSYVTKVGNNTITGNNNFYGSTAFAGVTYLTGATYVGNPVDNTTSFVHRSMIGDVVINAGTLTVPSHVYVGNDLEVFGYSTLQGGASINSDLLVVGASSFNTIYVTGAASFTDLIDVAGVRVAGLQVVGARQADITNATGAGGATVDAESRITIDLILAALRAHGLIAGGGIMPGNAGILVDSDDDPAADTDGGPIHGD